MSGRRPSYAHRGVANVNKLRNLVMNNASDPAQVFREAVSNCDDADARNAWLVPIPHPSEKAGLIVVDDGRGMTSPVDALGPNGALRDSLVSPAVA